jgi:FAD:protein FMN transferase
MASREARAEFEALGSTAVVAVTDAAALTGARAVVERVVDEFDIACSRFREDSELTAVNAAGGAPMRASRLLLEAVAASVRAARLTDGDVDPTVGEALIALGYDRDFAHVGDGGGSDGGGAGGDGEARDGEGTARRFKITAVPGWRTIDIDTDAGTIRVARGVRIDLGATAKALAADRAAADASLQAGCGVLVSLGGDISIAGPAPPDGWQVRVTDDHRSDVSAPGQWITLRSGGLATSSTTVRRWQTEAGFVHHLVDPATSRPVTGVWRTVSVTAASCLDANIASTAAIVRGERAVAWLESLELPSRLVSVDGVAHHLAGWPDDGDDLG